MSQRFWTEVSTETAKVPSETLTRLPRKVSVAKSKEVLSSLLRGTKVDLPTSVDDENLVELLVDAFSGLVERNKRGHLEDVREDSKTLGIVESGGGIESCRT